MEAGFDAAPDATTDGASDAVADAPVDATSDTGGAGGGFGTIAGPCAMIHGELGTTTPSYFSNRLDFGADPFDDPEDLPL
ncbi:MAG: hypothetical protein GWO04_35775, partial [Actinobacteria bacterium]|nr:hypothetical protein [Actinomycetota bacterium]